jgi:hypothetical protein
MDLLNEFNKRSEFFVWTRFQLVIGYLCVETVDVVGLFEVDEVGEIVRQILVDELEAALLHDINSKMLISSKRRKLPRSSANH